ncbi:MULTISPECIES: hypothetical protein [Mucilaginibacter]|uniref:hypothetical protein n=1 Tax=Mucilaginibacter TaxID=423349 RepID=UPI0020922EE5|nr:hypothetical protein [Mucilaginibacter flavidus]MCO5947965.1 hypothetical protein [Mucilaginibacter flavidus]
MGVKISNRCEKITLLLEKGRFAKITYNEKLALGIHLIQCRACRQYQKDSRYLNKAMAQCFKTSKIKPAKLNTIFKDSLAEQIRSRSGNQ